MSDHPTDPSTSRRGFLAAASAIAAASLPAQPVQAQQPAAGPVGSEHWAFKR
ncbi:MAG: hypothetical protein JWQ33_1224, partial [Ramlibacter sp.]|nr:hypothetical protein [Ramlibacter sp.]